MFFNRIIITTLNYHFFIYLRLFGQLIKDDDLCLSGEPPWVNAAIRKLDTFLPVKNQDYETVNAMYSLGGLNKCLDVS